MSLFNRVARNNPSTVASTHKENAMNSPINTYVKYTFDTNAQPTMTVAENKALELPVNTLNVCDDFIIVEGKRVMALYNHELRALTGPAKVVFTTFRGAYERVFNPGFNARFEDSPNFLNMKNLGRALRLIEEYNIFEADADFIQMHLSQLDGASRVLVFMAKNDPLLVRVVRFDDMVPTIYQMVAKHNRDINANLYVSDVYLSQHPVMKSDEEQAEKWNTVATEKGINAQVDPAKVMSKFTYAAYLAEGFKIIIPVIGRKVKDVNTDSVIVERWMTDEEHREEILNGYEIDGQRRQGRAQHILDGYRRQAAADAGLKWSDFQAEG